MSRFLLGSSGALLLDEKMHIHALRGADGARDYALSTMCFAVRDDKGRVYFLDRDFEEVKFKQTFLGANYKFTDKGFSAKVTASAVTPFGFGKDAHIPAALFSFKIKNTSKKERSYTLAALVEDLEVETLQSVVETPTYGGVRLTSATALSVQENYISHCLLAEGEVRTVRYLSGVDAKAEMAMQLRSGKTEERVYGTQGQRDAAAVLSDFALAPGESKTVSFVYAWYMPNVCLQGKTSVLMQDMDVVQYRDSLEIGAYVLEHKTRLSVVSDVCSTALKESLQGSAFVRAAMDNVEIAVQMSAFKFKEYCSSKLFVKNRYGQEIVYKSKENALFPSYVYFDFDREKGMVLWQLQNEKDLDILQKMELIWRLYRLYYLSGDAALLTEHYALAKQTMADVDALGLAAPGEAVLHSARTEESYDFAYSTAYILTLLCMEKIAAVLEETAEANAYGKLASDGRAFVKRNFFNGQFYLEAYPQESELQRCCLEQLRYVGIGHTLGISVLDAGQNEIALESIYSLNYIGDEDGGVHGVRYYDDAMVFDAAAEMRYVQALLQANRRHLAALVCKAQYAREAGALKHTADVALINALSDARYDAPQRILRLGKTSSVFFAKNALVVTEGGKGKTVRVFGEALRIDTVYCSDDAQISRIYYGDMELLFVRGEHCVYLNAPLVLSAGETLLVYIK